MKALFLDRDGTLIIDKHYLADPAGVELIPGALDGLSRARLLGYKLFMLTNQSGIGRGFHVLEDALKVNAKMETLFGFSFPLFDDICIAQEAPDQPSLYRKPSPRFILETIERYKLDPSHCYMVGDRGSDVEAGLNAKIHAVAVCTGELDAAAWQAKNYPGVTVFPSFGEFARTLE